MLTPIGVPSAHVLLQMERATLGAEHCQIYGVRDHCGGKDRVESIQEAAVTRNPAAHVFDTEIALDQRFGEIAACSGEEQKQTKNDADPPWLVQCEDGK